MPKAFLSYSRASEGLVHQLCDDLISCGIDEVWWDKRLVGAQSWWDTILRQIRAADLVVCLIDEGMPESTAVRREYQYAIDLGKPLLPILLSDHVEISTLPIQLAGKQYVDYRPDCHDPIAGLLVAVGNLPPAPSLPHPLPPEPPIPISEQDYLIEKVSSTEPLEHDIQIDVLSRLRRLGRSDDSEQRQFAQTSLRRLRNRSELLASVADDIDAATATPVPEKRSSRGLKTGAAVASGLVLLLIAAYLYHSRTGIQPDENNNDASPTSDQKITGDTDAVDDVKDTVQSNGDSVGGTDVGSHTAVETPLSDKEVEPAEEPESPVAAGTDAVRDTETTSVDKNVSSVKIATQPSTNTDGDKDSTTNEVTTEEAPTNEAITAVQTTVFEKHIVEDWDADFTVFEETSFDLCGFKQFTAKANSRDTGIVIEIRSRDRSIPDQPFRGLQVQVPSAQVYEILPGCRILLNHETTSGVSRIRVRAKGAQ